MVDTEVENTLREIRERVRAEAQARQQAHANSPPNIARLDAGEDSIATLNTGGEAAAQASEALARLEANLTTTARAWNRLPPLLSNRSGLVARLELWVKRQIKRATHWYTWEQVNFNASVHHALRDTLSALKSYEQHLARQYASLQTALETQKAEALAERERLEALNARIEAERVRAEEARAQEHARAEEARARVEEARARAAEEERARIEARLHTVEMHQHKEEQSWRTELRERVEHVLEEQRVCFRQLSLEAGEQAVAQERARRAAEARLAELTRRIEGIKAITDDE